MLRFLSFSSRSFLSFSICSGVFFGFLEKYLVPIFRLKMPACVQSPFSMQSATCSRMNSVFSLRSIDPNVSTCSSHKISAAALRSPCSFFMSDRIRVTRARSTSTNICGLISVILANNFGSFYLSLCDSSQCLDERQFFFGIGSLVDKRHGHLDHLRRGLLELAMLLR